MLRFSSGHQFNQNDTRERALMIQGQSLSTFFNQEKALPLFCTSLSPHMLQSELIITSISIGKIFGGSVSNHVQAHWEPACNSDLFYANLTRSKSCQQIITANCFLFTFYRILVFAKGCQNCVSANGSPIFHSWLYCHLSVSNQSCFVFTQNVTNRSNIETLS